MLSKRKLARRRLLDNVVCRWAPDDQIKMLYHARIGAKSRTLAQAAEEVFKDFDEGYLHAKPCIPAVNRWNKVYGPLAWWCFGVQFFKLVVEGFDHAGVQQANRHANGGVVVNIDAVGPVDEDNYRKVQKARWKKANTWLIAPQTPKCLCVSPSLFKLSLPLLASLFKSSAENNRRGSILGFLSPINSPVQTTMRAMRRALANPLGICWSLFQPWDESSTHDVACATWALMGEIFMRCEMVLHMM